MVNNKQHLGYLGEKFVQLQLAKKNYMTMTSKWGFHFDLLGQDGKRIEVKTALPSKSTKTKQIKGGGMKTYEYKVWKFRLSSAKQKTHARYYICVLFEDIKQEPITYFIFPEGKIKTFSDKSKCGGLCLYEADITGDFKNLKKLNRHQYKENWRLITPK